MLRKKNASVGGVEELIYDKRELEDIVKEIESRSKIVEIDFERRISFLEREIEIIRSLLGKIKDEKSLKMIIENAHDIRERLRALEDLKYVEHLEVIDAVEKVSSLSEDFKELKEKYNLLIESLKKIPELNEFALQFKEKYEEIERKVNQVESSLFHLQQEHAKIGDIVELKDKYEKIEKDVERALRDVREISKSFREALKVNERISSLMQEKYKEFSDKIRVYDSYGELIDELKSALDEVAKKVIEHKKEDLEKIYAKVEYALRRYDKALNLIQYELNYFLKDGRYLNEMKKLKEDFEGILKEIKELSPEKIEKLSAILNSRAKKIAQYEKEIKKMKGDISSLNSKIDNVEKEVLSLSQNFAELINKKMKSVREQLEQAVRKEIKKIFPEIISESIKKEIWGEISSMLASHEIEENKKIEVVKEFEKYLASRMDEIKDELLTAVREEIDMLKDEESIAGMSAYLKGEIIDLKKKVSLFMDEHAKKIKDLELKIKALEGKKYEETHPYIIE